MNERGRRADELGSEVRNSGKRKGRLTPASEIEMKPVYWAWAENGYGRIPVGELTLTAGHGEVGKSTFNTWLISRVTHGALPGRFFGKPKNCIIAANEDSWEHTIAPRLLASGADMSRVFKFDVISETDDSGMSVSLPTDFGILEERIDAAVTFFDQLLGAIDLKFNTHKAQDARKAIEPLAKIANRTESVIIGNAHFNKASSADPIARLLGSVEFRNVPRAIIMFARDRDGTYVMSRGKNNLGLDWPSLEYAIESAAFTVHGRPFNVGRFVLGGETDVRADDIISSEGDGKRKGPEPVAQNEVVEILESMFRDQDTWNAEDAKAELKKAGGGWDPKTVTKARARVGIKATQVFRPDGKFDRWVWTTKSEKLRIRNRKR